MALFDAFGTDAQRQAADAQIQGLSNANAEGQKSLTQGADALRQNYAAGLDPFLKNYATATGGQGAYADATGAAGPAGYDRATSAFRTSPGYQFVLDQGNQNILRNKAATGQLASGSTNVDLQKFGQGSADQEWQNYIKNLLPFLDQSNKAATGIGTLDASLGNQLNTNFTNAANMNYGTYSGEGNANANADLAALNASGNSWNALMQGGKLAAGLFGGFGMPGSSGGGSSSASPSITSLFTPVGG